MTIDFQVCAELRDLLEHGSFNFDLPKIRPRSRDPFAQLLLIVSKRLAKCFAAAIVSLATLNDVDSILKIVFGFYFGMQPETIEQLRPEFALFRISRTYQDKMRGMLH